MTCGQDAPSPSTGLENESRSRCCDVATAHFNPWGAASSGNLNLLRESLVILNLSATVVDAGQEYTILHASSSHSQIGIMEWLLSQITDPDERNSFVNLGDRDGDTALHYAGSVVAAKFLVEVAGIDVSLENEVGMTALDAKRWEVEATMQEEHFVETNRDYVDLKGIVEFLESITESNMPQ